MKPESIFIKCDCTCNVLEVEYVPNERQFYAVLWDNGHTHTPLSRKERIRWCENIMKTGKPWADSTIVNKQNARRLVAFLNKYINHGKSKRSNHGRTRSSTGGNS